MGSNSELDTDILRRLTDGELLALVELYKSKNDKYHFLSIYNHCRWISLLDKSSKRQCEKYKPFRKEYYTHRHGNISTNGTYISLQWDEMLSVQFHTFQESLQELKECIVKTNLIDWNSGPLLTAIHNNCADETVELIKSLGGTFDFEIRCSCMFLPSSFGIRIQVPNLADGYKLSRLEEKHAEFIHAHWPHNDEASVDFIRGMIEFNLTLGIIRLSDGELIAWIFQNEFYGLGILQVIPEEQGKGFGKYLTQAMTKQIAISGETEIINSFAVIGNVRAETICKNIGFQKDCITKWVQFKKS